MTSLRYMDKVTLEAFLAQDFKPTTGVLQRFVMPAGEKNTLIRAVWTPHGMEAEQRTNKKPMVRGSASSAASATCHGECAHRNA